jgi:hypothetical protein
MLKVIHDADASNENGTAGGSLLDEIVRDGAPGNARGCVAGRGCRLHRRPPG